MNVNPELDALIVRNIADLEAAITRAQQHMDKRLWKEMADFTKEAVDDAKWRGKYDGENEDVWFSSRAWSSDDSNSEPEFSFWIGGLSGPSGGEAHTWIATALGANAEGASVAIIFHQTLLKGRSVKKLFKEETTLLSELIDHGLSYNESTAQLYLPLQIDGEALARAFEDDSFEEALKPLALAIANLDKALPQLTQLVQAIRAAAAE